MAEHIAVDPARKLQALQVGRCNDGHVVLLVYSRGGELIGEAHMEPAQAESVIADLRREILAVTGSAGSA